MFDASAATFSSAAVETAARAMVASSLERARPRVEAALDKRGLSADAINNQDLRGLEIAVRDIDALINNPEQLWSFPAFGGDPADGGRRIRVNVRPILLERREQILQRLSQLESAQGLQEVTSSARTMEADDTEASIDAITGAASALETRIAQRNSQIVETREQRAEAIEDLIARQAHEMNMKRRNAAILQSWLSRDVVSGAAGLLLIAIFGVSLVVAMFTGVTVTSIVSDSFLLVLGYFFGQSTKPAKEKD